MKSMNANDLAEEMEEIQTACARIRKDALELARLREMEEDERARGEQEEQERMNKLAPIALNPQPPKIGRTNRGNIYMCPLAGPDKVCRVCKPMSPSKKGDIKKHIVTCHRTPAKHKGYGGDVSWIDFSGGGGARRRGP